ncbi:TetR/AcrR family transcriptional regulator [Streptococcus sanguinis]|uniref:TetR/AcrR family transcriptional regulator n=1 Tax=Streptococcus sanguinis TaxID=1305 RepID=UPI000F685B60|nr:TetR/AcrR family transcriptional regulator [Streptococcus sanguinis]RSJ41318.1 hypothetical protein D8820_00740 [Streptococcus sanguinis]
MTLHTRKRILDAFFTLAEQNPTKVRFTFTDIAKTADLSRQAIYKRHFNNVNEIIDYIHEKLNDEFNQACSQYKFTSSNPFLSFSETILPIIYRNRDWIRTLYTTSVDPFWSDFIISYFTDWISQNIKLDDTKLDMPSEISNTLLAKCFNLLIENWITQTYPLSLEKFSNIFLNLVSSPLTSFTIPNNQTKSSNKIIIKKPSRRKTKK